MAGLTATLLRDEAQLAALAPAWAALWQASGASPFQHPAWLLPWWRVFGTGAPRVALLHGTGDRLLGVLPLYELAEEGKILPFGVGVSDYVDAVIDPAAPPGAAALLLRTALDGASLPCHLPDLPPDAVLRDAEPPPGWHAECHVGETCPVLAPLLVPPRQRRKVRMVQNRATRAGYWAVLDDVAAPTDMLFAALLRLHTQGWEARGEPGVLADPRVLAFHAAALPQLQQAGLLRLCGLVLGDALAAVIYALQRPGRLFLYLTGFDPARAFESPGALLLSAMIARATAEGVGELHFLRGAEAYKYAWGATDRRNQLLILEPA